jgi:hypothetical protein
MATFTIESDNNIMAHAKLTALSLGHLANCSQHWLVIPELCAERSSKRVVRMI